MKKSFIAIALLTLNFNAYSLELEKSCYSISGMHCGSCKEKIENKFKEKAGINAYEVSLRDEMALVSFDKKAVSDEEIVSLIKDAGYVGKKTKCIK